ncbi:hypothetical protein FRC01_013368 [Tulasnella sp. 417]|nr:hypothetical protein FRC01_013368 [Tulasnella sp. 417]
MSSRGFQHRVAGEKQRKRNLELMRVNFKPEVTGEDPGKEERDLAQQEEAAVVATSSVPPKSPVEPPAEPELEAPPTREQEPEEEEEAAPATCVADHQTKEQRRGVCEEAARLKKEAIERRAETAAGGFGFEEPQLEQQHPQEFGEFVIGQHSGVGVAWTESDGASSHPSPHYQQQPPLPAMHIPIASMQGLPFHQLHPDEHPLSPSDDELMDYGAEYAVSRRPRKSTALMGMESASSSDRLERMSNGSGTSRARAHMVPLPASTFGSPRKPTILHRATGSGTLSSHSGLSGQGGQVYYQPVALVQFQAPVYAELVEIDGVPGGLNDLEPPSSAGFSHHQGEYVRAPADYAPQVQAHQESDGIPGGLNSDHTRSRAGSVTEPRYSSEEAARTTEEPYILDRLCWNGHGRPGKIYQKDKVNELQGYFKYADKRVRIIRDLTEIHEVTWVTDGKTLNVYIKYLRYGAIIEGDIDLTISAKQVELKDLRTDENMDLPPRPQHLAFYWLPMERHAPSCHGNISQYIKANPEVDRLKILAQVASGLKFLYSESIVHGLVQPTNVIIADDGRPMLMDFGMAPDVRMVERNITMADSAREIVGYMSPELIEERPYTTVSDVYAFGSLVLEVLTDQPPYCQLAYAQAMIQITQQKKPSPDDHPCLPASSPLWELLQRCWSTSPDERPRIEEVHNWLDAIVKPKRSGLLNYIGLFYSFASRLVSQPAQQASESSAFTVIG